MAEMNSLRRKGEHQTGRLLQGQDYRLGAKTAVRCRRHSRGERKQKVEDARRQEIFTRRGMSYNTSEDSMRATLYIVCACLSQSRTSWLHHRAGLHTSSWL
jgi:hypothetical protein